MYEKYPPGFLIRFACGMRNERNGKPANRKSRFRNQKSVELNSKDRSDEQIDSQNPDENNLP